MAHAFTYQAPYGTFHFSEGLLMVELAEDLIVDLPLMQRVSAQRLELLGDREVAELIVNAARSSKRWARGNRHRAGCGAGRSC